jgi:hypothetical protein
MKSYTFRDCNLELLETLFGLEETTQSENLDVWLKQKAKITPFEKAMILHYQELLDFHLLGWNEQELAMNFIGPLIGLLKFTTIKFNLFAERPLEETLQSIDNEDIKLSGKPDSLIASGRRSPRIPFFSFHEHKPETEGGGDPTGQVLAAMLVGQAKNKEYNAPMYGCYVIGQNWYFLILENKKYTIAPPFAATSKEVFDIYRVLKALKNNIEERLNSQ